jgi:transcriptional regulator with XRE-family HTH domain
MRRRKRRVAPLRRDDSKQEKGKDGLTMAERLHKLRAGVLGPDSTYKQFAQKCGGDVPENTVKAWFNGVALPGIAHLRSISRGFGVSIDFIINGAETAEEVGTETVPDRWRAICPAGIPEPWREPYGALTQEIKDVLLGLSPAYRDKEVSLEEAQDATLRIVTATFQEVLRQRGERKKTPSAILTDIRAYKGQEELIDYLLWSRLAAEIAVRHVYRMPPKLPQQEVAPKKRVKTTARKGGDNA